MKKPSFSRFIYIALLSILLATHACDCNRPTRKQPNDQPNNSTKIKGFWHTYIQEPDPQNPINILHAVNRGPSNSPIPEVYNRKYIIYPVVSNGDCGYLAFIPILLADILVGDKWKAWIENIYNTLYKKAQELIEQTSWPADSHYVNLRPTDKLSKLYADTKALLQKLSLEPAPRKLHDEEASLLVDFLRQCILMKVILNNSPTANTASLVKINNELSTKKVSRKKQFWASLGDLKIFNIGYGAMFDDKSNQNSSPANSHYRMDYYGTERIYMDGMTPIGRGWKNKEEIPQPNIMIYFKNGDHFDYIIAQDVDKR